MDYNQIIKFFLSTSVITLGIIYLAKLVIEKIAESKIEKYKNSLDKNTESFRHQLNIDAESFRHQLNTAAIEHQIKYSKLYEERGQVIKFIYNLLLGLENSLSSLTTLFQGPGWTTDIEREKRAGESISNLKASFEANRIFFSEDLCHKIESVLATSRDISIEMHFAKRIQINNDKNNKELSKEELLKPSHKWRELDAQVQTEIKTAMLDLAQEFRVLIGVV